MKILLLCVGTTKDKAVTELVEKYSVRIGRYMPFALECVPDVKNARDAENQKNLEGERLLSRLKPDDRVVLLDERGQEYTSVDFATKLERLNLGGCSRLVLVIGGPYGFSRAVYERSNELLSLAKMTFPHEIVRIFITEQLYRAMTILRGEPYHHA